MTQTAQRVRQAMALLGSDDTGQVRAQRLLESALQGVRTQVVLADRPLILAYYQVESALAALPNWNGAVRDGLRQAVESLYRARGFDGLENELQAQSDRLVPHLQGLQKLASRLRRRIEQQAGSASMPAS